MVKNAVSESEEYLEFLKTRRSIRVFKPRTVPDNLLYRILNVARFAPSAKNMQPWEFIIVRKRELLEKLSRIHRWAKPISNAPVAIVVICDKELAPVSYQVDCANAAMYIMLAAHALGLGTVWIQSLRNVREIQEILNIPPNKIPIAIIALGWPAEKPEPKPRKSLEEIVHEDLYSSSSA